MAVLNPNPVRAVMGHRHEISDADWDRIKDRLPGQPGQHGGVAADNRRFLNAVLYTVGRPPPRGPSDLRSCSSWWR